MCEQQKVSTTKIDNVLMQLGESYARMIYKNLEGSLFYWQEKLVVQSKVICMFSVVYFPNFAAFILKLITIFHDNGAKIQGIFTVKSSGNRKGNIS